jgi:hypothetical protein
VPASWTCLLMLTLQAAPQVEVTTLSESARTGTLTEIAGGSLVLQQDQQAQSLPLTDVLEVRATTPADASPLPEAATVFLADGSRLLGTKLVAAGQTWQWEHPQLGTVAAPREQVRSVRFAVEDAAVAAAWEQLATRETRQDLVVIRKGDVLDHVDGVVGAIDDAAVKFLLDGDDVTIKRERVFGIVLASRDRRPTPRALRVELAGGDVLFASRVGFRDGRWQMQWLTPEPLEADAAAVRSVDFSAGKVVYLSAIEPREVDHTPYYNTRWDYQKDRNLVGRPLRVGPRSYARGLAIHSKTRLRYRLGGEYRRFTAMLGLDPEIAAGIATFRVVGDGKTLFESDVSVLDAPKLLEIDVSGVVELDLIVDFGPDELDTGDRVHLGDAKVTK